MSERNDKSSRPLAALGEPEPPAALRERALAGARAAWERPAYRWQALWESRPLRIAWAAAVVLLVAANVAVRAPWRSHGGPSAAAPRERSESRELGAVVALPRLRPEYAGTDAAARADAQRLAPQPDGKPRGSEDKS